MSDTTGMTTLQVELGERSYPIHVGRGLLGQPELVTPYLRGGQVMVVSNETVAPLYMERVTAAFRDRQVEQVILPDGERFKDLETLNRIYDGLLQARFGRDCTVVALGGGVVGDMAGFAAATYQRGVDFIQVPTTLLAQVDSSVGGKTGVNHPLGKNMIGAFHQPRCVVADTDTLNTLDDRQLAAGIAEVIKYGLINDPGFFDWLEAHMDALRGRDPQALAYAIEQSCRDKAAVVAADEREGGARALLNLGHTFGHAIEAGVGYGEWLHGEAVAAGMVMAAELSERLGWTDARATDRVRALIARAGLPTAAPPTMSRERFLELMAVDKKVLAGRLRLVLLEGIGRSVVTDQAGETDLAAALDAHLARAGEADAG